MIGSRTKIAASLVGLACAAPAMALSFQPAPRNANGSSKLVDPDEQAEKMVEQSRRDDRRAYANRILNSSSLVQPGGQPVGGFRTNTPFR